MNHSLLQPLDQSAVSAYYSKLVGIMEISHIKLDDNFIEEEPEEFSYRPVYQINTNVFNGFGGKNQKIQ